MNIIELTDDVMAQLQAIVDASDDFVGVDRITIVPTRSGTYEVWFHVAGERGDYFRGTYSTYTRAISIASTIA